MRLPDFIRANRKPIIDEWEVFAKTLSPAIYMSRLQLRDHIEQILSFIAEDIESTQTPSQQLRKSYGKSDSKNEEDSAAETHGDIRHEEGFDIVQMVSEYRALRSSIIKLWTNSQRTLTDEDVLDLTRFNESIDQALAESVVRFIKKVDYSKDLLLGVLGHDIRSPLGAIKMSAHLMGKVGALNEKQTNFATQIESCTSRITDIVSGLLDLTRARLGSGLPIVKKPMDIGVLAQQIVEEMRSQHQNRTILLEITGEVEGEWDSTRLGQVFSNLIGNAVQYSPENSLINITITGDTNEIKIMIHNTGTPIPQTKLTTIFDSFTRVESDNNQTANSNLGLGLFITKEIISSHDGTITVTSNEEKGTIFTVRLPRFS